MLTLKSKFSEFIALCVSNMACKPAVDMMKAEQETVGEEQSFVDGMTEAWKIDYADGGDELVEDRCIWALKVIGKDMDLDIRKMFLAKVNNPYAAYKLYLKCPFFTEEEKIILQDKYSGIADDIAKITTCLAAIKKNREFNTARAEAVTTCKSIKEAKKLLESKTSFKIKLSFDDTAKSADDLKKILEAERADVTMATNLVMKEHGFVDAEGNGSASVFQAWYEDLK